MSSRLDKKKYQHIILWEKLGIKIRKILILFFLVTIAVQSIIAFNIDLLPQSTTMELEGKAVMESYHYESRGQIKIVTEDNDDLASLKIYINGEPKEIKYIGGIVLDVRNNDIIEIDGIGIIKNIDIIVKEVSENVVFPKVGMRYKIEGNIIALGRVKLK